MDNSLFGVLENLFIREPLFNIIGATWPRRNSHDSISLDVF